jgi:L-cysteine S-thiosulfotransferase
MTHRAWLSAVLGAGLLSSATALGQQGTPSQAQASPPATALVKFESKDHAIQASLTGKPGDAEQGKKVVVGRQLGNCLACHQITALKDEPFHGNTGPSLDGIASRLSPGEIRLRIVDATQANPDTMMPAFYRTEGLNRVLPRFQGKPILTAEQVEDVVAFLGTLK